MSPRVRGDDNPVDFACRNSTSLLPGPKGSDNKSVLRSPANGDARERRNARRWEDIMDQDHDLDRREFTIGLLTASFAALALHPSAANAATESPSTAVLDQPWAVWDKDAKPVRGGIFRVAAEQYIGKMNPNHWPVQDWVTMSYFHERLMFTDGQYNPTVPWLAEKLTWESPQDVVMKLREGVTFHDGSPCDAK